MKRNLLFAFLGIYVILSLLFFARFQLVGQAVYGDGIYYWAYTHSLVIDKDLDLRNEASHTYSPESNNALISYGILSDQNDLAKIRYYPLGSSLLWIPSFVTAHAAVRSLSGLELPVAANGYSDIYQLLVGFWNVGMMTGGLFVLYSLLLRYFSKRITLITCVSVFLGTNLLYYSTVDVLNSHSSAFFLSGIFVYLWATTRDKRQLRIYLALGLMLGLMTMVRPQDGLYGIVFFIEAIFRILRKKNRDKIFPTVASSLLVLAIGFLLGFAPQLITSRVLYGNIFLLPYTSGASGFHFFTPKLMEIITDPQRGLLFYSPLFLIGFVGLFFMHKKERVLQYAAIAVILFGYCLVAMWSGWSQGEAFGMRMFISFIPLFSLGLAALTKTLSRSFSSQTIVILAFCFIVQNILMIAAFHLFLHGPTIVGNQLSRSGQLRIMILKELTGIRLP